MIVLWYQSTDFLVMGDVVWLVAIVDEPSRHLRSHLILLATTAEFCAERSSNQRVFVESRATFHLFKLIVVIRLLLDCPLERRLLLSR